MDKIRNFLTFGLYNRVVEAERQAQSYYSELKRMIENLVHESDIEDAVEEEINKRSILTEDNFCPSDYDCVVEGDYDLSDLDTFLTEDDVRDFVTKTEMYDAIQARIDLIAHDVLEGKIKAVLTLSSDKENES